MIEDAIRTILVNAATPAASRIALDMMPEQTALPYVRIDQIGGAVLLAHDGPVGHRKYNFQVSAFASTGAGARALIQACRAALHMYSGTVGSDVIQAIYAQSEPRVFYERESSVYSASMDFTAGYVG